MKRRDFITLVSGAAVVWPVVARAQRPAKPVVGVVAGQSSDADKSNAVAFHKGLNETGYVDGQNVTVEYLIFADQLNFMPELCGPIYSRLEYSTAVVLQSTPCVFLGGLVYAHKAAT